MVATLMLAPPAIAQTDPAQQVQKALDDARHARDLAQAALQQADEAIKAAQASLDAMKPSVPPAPPSATTSVATLHCDEGAQIGNLSTAERVLTAEDGKDPALGANWFTQNCLGLTKASQFGEADLALRFTGGKGDGVYDIGGTYTMRRSGPSDPILNKAGVSEPATRSSYWRFSPGVFVKVGDDDNPALFDFEKTRIEKGAGIKLGIEFGQGFKSANSELQKTFNEALAAARRDCLAEQIIQDPLTDVHAVIPAMISPARAIKQCTGDALVKWMSEDSRASGYWKKLIRPIWGYDTDTWRYIGAEGQIGISDTDYFRFTDPAHTGATLLTALPTGKLGDPDTLRRHPFSVTLYGGLNGRWKLGGDKVKAGVAGSIGYRRQITVPSEAKDQIVCPLPDPAKVASPCETANIGPPYQTEGFAFSLALRGQLPRLWYFPELAASMKVSYEADTHRWGVAAPFYLVLDSDDKLSGGIKFACQGKGRTEQNYELKEDCNAVVFVGTKFSLSGAP